MDKSTKKKFIALAKKYIVSYVQLGSTLEILQGFNILSNDLQRKTATS
jgi:hypothetical protein